MHALRRIYVGRVQAMVVAAVGRVVTMGEAAAVVIVEAVARV